MPGRSAVLHREGEVKRETSQIKINVVPSCPRRDIVLFSPTADKKKGSRNSGSLKSSVMQN
jgi:hypothetical protein